MLHTCTNQVAIFYYTVYAMYNREFIYYNLFTTTSSTSWGRMQERIRYMYVSTCTCKTNPCFVDNRCYAAILRDVIQCECVVVPLIVFVTSRRTQQNVARRTRDGEKRMSKNKYNYCTHRNLPSKCPYHFCTVFVFYLI